MSSIFFLGYFIEELSNKKTKLSFIFIVIKKVILSDYLNSLLNISDKISENDKRIGYINCNRKMK